MSYFLRGFMYSATFCPLPPPSRFTCCPLPRFTCCLLPRYLPFLSPAPLYPYYLVSQLRHCNNRINSYVVIAWNTDGNDNYYYYYYCCYFFFTVTTILWLPLTRDFFFFNLSCGWIRFVRNYQTSEIDYKKNNRQKIYVVILVISIFKAFLSFFLFFHICSRTLFSFLHGWLQCTTQKKSTEL